MKYMGIDFGTKRVGVALSDEGGTLAFPYDIYPNSPDLVGEIAILIRNEEVRECVIGESVDQMGQANPLMKVIDKFKRELAEETDVTIHMQKEFFTSVHARPGKDKSSRNARETKKDVVGPADASAAALILQRYLDKVAVQNKK